MFFLAIITGVRILLAEPNTLAEAIAHAKEFLRKWLSRDPVDWQFQRRIADEIQRLEKEQEAAKRFKKGPPPSQGG